MITIKNNNLINYANRGMTLEDDINKTNLYYRNNNIAYIRKNPTPIKALKVVNNKITDGFFEEKSTLDYIGIYKGQYIEFDAKETNIKNYFPISNIKEHQISHIKEIIKYNGIIFLIVRFNSVNKTYVLSGKKLLEYISNSKCCSIPISYFEDNCPLLALKYQPRLDYLKIIDIL